MTYQTENTNIALRSPLNTQARLEDTPLCSGSGKYHSDGGKNPRQLGAITLADLDALLVMPQSNAPKDTAQWAIFSDLLTRNHDAQRQRGTYYALWVDVDEPPMTFAEMVEVAGEVIPGDFMAYASRSATEEKQKARFIVPLAEPIKGQDYQAYAKTLNRKMTEAGIPADTVSERTGQPCYLPNRGDFYEYHSTDFLGAMSPGEWASEIAEEKAAQEAAEEARKQEHAQALANAAQRVANGTASPVDAFKAEFPIALMLDSYGYQSRGNRWLSPNSSTKSPGVSITSDGLRWISQHGSDEAAGIGRAMQGGGCSGDAFDLYCFYEHGGDFDAAVKAAGAMLKTQDGRSVTQANQDSWRAAQAARDFDDLTDPQIPPDSWLAESAGAVSHTGGESPAQPDAANDDAAPSLLDNLDRYKAKHLLATTPPPQRYIVDGLLPEPVTAAIVAPGSTGKSFWLMQLAACVSTGVPFMGMGIPEPGPVLMIGAEDDQNEMARRIHSITREYQWQGDLLDPVRLGENFYAVSALGQNNLLTEHDGKNIVRNRQNINNTIAAANSIPGLRLIIIDPISRFRSGDENDNEAATRFVEALEEIRTATGVTVLCAHHSRKGSDGKDADSIRGASALVDAFRWAATLAKLKEDDKLDIHPDDLEKTIRLNVVKSNYKSLEGCLFLRRGVGGVLHPTDAPGMKPTANDTKAEERYSAALPKLQDLIRRKDEEGQAITRRAIREYAGKEGIFGMGEQALRGTLNRAIEEGKIKLHDDNTLHLW